jgi:hypothetical protein
LVFWQEGVMMLYESIEHNYGFYPKVPEHVVEQMMQGINDFATLMKHNFERARKMVSWDIE